MEFRIAPDVAARFPGIEIHAARAQGFLAGADQLDHAGQLREAVARVGTLGIDKEKLAAYPPIARWREAYAALKVRPSAFRASIESLLRRALGGADLALPIASVNLYNAVSLDALAPMGAYDMAKLPPEPMLLRFADPARDRFTPLGGKVADFPLNPDLVVYAGGDTVLCWGFNHRDNVETALDAQSDDIVFFSEALNPEDGARSARAMDEVRTRLAAIGVACSDPVRADRAQPGFCL
ncbi:B3/B4 domain-containing protein [Dongia sedimenti]|uniref:Phenylalanine--tRNA ligase beta subunit-related protein n=1 Tax=Dongia sedimenti TaxID=3064282 RepID=A0ABU0YLF6_9PROT|nr:phenylalanine--tRNA ligase beta subunit-related protein [Rhodospirillaceae bacterium R-7]